MNLRALQRTSAIITLLAATLGIAACGQSPDESLAPQDGFNDEKRSEDPGASVMAATVEEIESDPGSLSIAKIDPNANPAESASCQSDYKQVLIDPSVSRSAKVGSLCADSDASGNVLLRACGANELSLERAAEDHQVEKEGCWFCTGDACTSNPFRKQRKEGNTGPCWWNPFETCCYAINSGCC